MAAGHAVMLRSGVDSARSWLVAVSCCWINFFSALMYKSSGVVYMGVLQTLGVSREEASWPLTLLAVFIFTTAPVAGVLALYIDIWKISLCGCLLSSISVCLCFWANSVIHLIVCLGVVQGFALGLLTLHNVIINQHFEKHRATASGISYAGPTLASIVYPPLVQVLFEWYGLRGSLLLFGGIMLHAVAGAFLQMEPNPRKAGVASSPYKVVPRDPVPEDTECSKNQLGNKDVAKEEVPLASTPHDCGADVQRAVRVQPGAPDTAVRLESGLRLFAAVPNIRRNASVLLEPMFYLICASFAAVLFTMTTYLTVVVDFAVDNGVSRINSVLLISAYSVADLVARLGSGWISDRGFVSRGNMMALNFLVGGLSLFAMPVFTTYAGQVTMAVVYGWATGCTMILVSVLLTEHIGLDRLPVSFGVTSFVAGALCLSRPPLIADGARSGVMDSPRSWAVAAACCWINVFTFALVRSAAVVYVALLRTFPVTREQASWPVNLSVVCYFLTGPIAGVLARYIPIWKLTVLGCLGGSLAVCVCYFAQSMLFLDVFLGVTHGTCIGLLALFSVVINQHFHKYRAMASGISNAGFTIGGLIFPPVIQLLADHYGIRGALLLVGALMLNSVAGAFLQRNPPKTQPETPSPLKRGKAENTGGMVQDPEEGDAMIKISEKSGDASFRRSVSAFDDGECSDIKHGTQEAGEGDAVYLQVKSSAEKDQDVNSDEEGDENAKLRALDAQGHGHPKVVRNHTPVVKVKRSSRERRPLLSFLLFPAFYLISFSLAIILFNMSTYMTVIVDFAVDRGVSKWNAVYLIFAYAVADLLARLGSGWITDRKYLLKSTMMGSHFVMWGASLYMMPLCSQYYCQVALSVLSGWCNGSTLILIGVLFMELVGIDKLGVCFGVATTFAGLLGLSRPSLIGFYRDAHGDYEGLFGLIGGVTWGMSLLWLCYYGNERCASRKKQERTSRTRSKMAAIFTPEGKS